MRKACDGIREDLKEEATIMSKDPREAMKTGLAMTNASLICLTLYECTAALIEELQLAKGIEPEKDPTNANT